MPDDVANLQLTISGKDDASQAFESLTNAVQGAQGILQQIASTASQAGQNLDQMGQSTAGAAAMFGNFAGNIDNLNLTIRQTPQHTTEAASGFDVMGASSQVAAQGLNSASEAANAFGVNIAPATSASHEFLDVLGSFGEGIGTATVGVGVFGLALAGIGAAFAGEMLNGAQEFGIELIHLSELFGMSEASIAGMEIRMNELGMSTETLNTSLAFLSRNMETLSVGADQAGFKDATTDAKAAATATREIADAQAQLAQAYQDTQDKITSATAKEVQNLDDLAAKHTETIAKIESDIQSLTDNYNEAEADRARSLKEGIADRAASEKDSLATMGFNHQESIQRLNRQAREARTSQARQDVQFSIAQENEKYAFAVSMEKRKNDEADARDKRRYAEQEAKAQEQYNKQLTALQKKIDDENTKYDAQVIREQARYDDELERLNKAYAKQEEATAKHIARTQAIEAGKTAGGGAKETPFEVELRKMLTYAGLTKDAQDAMIQSIQDGEKSVGDILPLIADGFQKQKEDADKSGQSINQAGEAMKLFGRSGYQMLPFLQEGGDAFRNDAALAGEFGVAIDPEKVKAYTKAHADLMWSLKGLEVQIGEALMPVMTRWLGELSGWVKDHRDDIVGFFETVGNKILDFAHYISDHRSDILDFFKKFGDTLGQVKDVAKEVIDFVVEHWPEIQNVISVAWEAMKPEFYQLKSTLDSIQVILDLLNGDWGKAWKDMKQTLSDQWKEMKAIFDPLLGIADKIKGVFEDVDWGSVWGAVFDPLKTLGKDAINIGFIDPINAVLEFMRNLHIHIREANIGPVHLPGGDISIPGLPPNIPHLEYGGIVTAPTLAVVGDAPGGEAIIPLRNGGMVSEATGQQIVTLLAQILGVNEAQRGDIQRIQMPRAGNRGSTASPGQMLAATGMRVI